MLLRRIGNKTKIAKKIISCFPEHHTMYVEPFFGAGGIFFNKYPVAKYNILNDIDDDVINLYDVIMNNYDEFKYLLEITPYANSIFRRFIKAKESDPVKKAVRFVYLSNFSYLGKSDCLKFGAENNKAVALNNLEWTLKFLKNNNLQFTNLDFRKSLRSIHFINISVKHNTLVYCDPPYLNTCNNYSDSFTENDTIDLFEILIDMKVKFAVSEFESDFINDVAKSKGLNKIGIAERQTLKSRNTEILITNFEINRQLF